MRHWASSFLSGRSAQEAGLQLIWPGNPRAASAGVAGVYCVLASACLPCADPGHAAPPASLSGDSRASLRPPGSQFT